MKIFLDTGDVEAIKRASETGLLDGVTTNPSLIAQTGRDFRQVVTEICQLLPGPVSVEAMAETAGEMINEARALAVLAPNIVVKIPMTAEGMKAVPELEKERGIKTNVTMVFSPTQAFLAMKAGASFVSIVLSRLDAIGNESDALVRDSVLIKSNYDFTAEIIAGSLKTQNHILSCLRAGVDIATMPEGLFNQLFRHPLTDLGLDSFKRDWNTAKVTSV
jgi:transaldolase